MPEIKINPETKLTGLFYEANKKLAAGGTVTVADGHSILDDERIIVVGEKEQKEPKKTTKKAAKKKAVKKK